MRLGLLPGLTLAAGIALAQYPGQYPPGQYPPGQYPPTYPPSTYPGGYPPTYPPGSYPPNTYPPNTYPLPGRVPIGVPIPEIKLPRRGEKDKSKPKADGDLTIEVASVEGSLRKIGEKDLVLEAGKNLLHFRLLAKTQFRDKDGEPVRDSLLHPGDELSVTANTDDPETALRVTLLKSGSPSDRAAAERPYDAASVRAPKAEDLGKASAATVEEAAPAAHPATPDSAPDTPGAAPAPARIPGVVKPLGSDAEVIGQARAAASDFTSTLPNYIAKQLTTRYFSTTWPARWEKIDEVTADVAVVGGKEDYRNIQVNGVPLDRPPERTGTWSTGEFSTTLEDLLSPATDAHFKRRGVDHIAARHVVVFDYTVEQPRSHWTLVSPDDRRYRPAYEGAIWIDRETGRVLRLEQRTTEIPKEFPLLKAESSLTYAFASIDGKPYLLPASSENVACWRGSGTCVRNTIEFKDYRKFTADSTVTFGKE